MDLLRRAGRSVVDTLVTAGLASAGFGSRDPGTGQLVHTRFTADAVLENVRDEEPQSELVRAAWSVFGALALGMLGAATIVAGWAIGFALILLLALGQLLLAGAVLLLVWLRATKGSAVHLGGAALAAVAIYVSIVAPPPLLGEWALAGLLLGVAALLGLVLGRR